MISIKKYLDLDSNELNKYRPPTSEELMASILEAYRGALGAMGNSGVRACPTLGPGLQRNLMLLAEGLAKTITPPSSRKPKGTWKSNSRNGESRRRSTSSSEPGM